MLGQWSCRTVPYHSNTFTPIAWIIENIDFVAIIADTASMDLYEFIHQICRASCIIDQEQYKGNALLIDLVLEILKTKFEKQLSNIGYEYLENLQAAIVPLSDEAKNTIDEIRSLINKLVNMFNENNHPNIERDLYNYCNNISSGYNKTDWIYIISLVIRYIGMSSTKINS